MISPEDSSDSLIQDESQWGMDPTIRRIYSSMVQPDFQPIRADNGGFVVSSIESYTVSDEWVKPISCSFIARRNLAVFAEAFHMYAPFIAQGDANDLIKFGRANNTLTSFFDHKALIDELNKRKLNSFETVFDAYRHVPTRSHALQGHRATLFLGDDDRWYILDPIDGGKTIRPQLFEEYMKNDVDNAEWLVRFPGFSYINPLGEDHLSMVLPFLSRELQLFFQPDYLLNVPTIDSEETDNIAEHIDALITNQETSA